MLRYLLDTDICIYIKAKKPWAVREKFARQATGSVGMSVITWGELLYGAHRSQEKSAAMSRLHELAELVPVIDMPREVGVRYAEIRAGLSAAGTIIGANDLWIAAHALAADLTVVTNNEREFRRVPGLKVENWAA
jgi:tRNA(fMet)-specific endonuclease VapC